MKITIRNEGDFVLFFAGDNLDEECGSLHRQIVRGRLDRLHNPASMVEWKVAYDEVEREGLKQIALEHLCRQSLCSAQLHKKLVRFRASRGAIEQVFSELTSLGYLDDQSWADAYVRFLAARHYGARAIAMKLRLKGLDEESIRSALSDIEGCDSEDESVRHLLSTRYSSKLLTDRAQRDKVIAALVRKGHKLSTILRVIHADKTGWEG